MLKETIPAEIIEYRNEHHEIFRLLNIEWLEHYHLLEDHDSMVLDDPQGTILDGGGVIYLAEVDGKIVGSAALMKEDDAYYELAKMAVTKEYRGRGISRLLIEKCLAAAKKMNAKHITLFSNHQLKTAIDLYQKYGFRHIDVIDSPFETADVKMELTL